MLYGFGNFEGKIWFMLMRGGNFKMWFCCKRVLLIGMVGKFVIGIFEKRGLGEGDGWLKGGNLKFRKGFCGDCWWGICLFFMLFEFGVDGVWWILCGSWCNGLLWFFVLFLLFCWLLGFWGGCGEFLLCDVVFLFEVIWRWVCLGGVG